MSDFPLQILKIEREIVRLYDLVSRMEARVALSDQNNALLWYDRSGCTTPNFVLSASPSSPQNSGVSITFTATLTGFPYTPTGTIQFQDGVSNLGSPVVLVGGIASLVTSSLSVATHTVNAVYSGDSTFCAGTQSISYVIASSFNPCSGGFTAGTYHLHDPAYPASTTGSLPYPLGTTGENTGLAKGYNNVGAFGSCAAPSLITIWYRTRCASGSLVMDVDYCGDNVTHCPPVNGGGVPPSSCNSGASAIGMLCTLASATSTSLAFTIPSGIDPNSPYVPYIGSTITIDTTL